MIDLRPRKLIQIAEAKGHQLLELPEVNKIAYYYFADFFEVCRSSINLEVSENGRNNARVDAFKKLMELINLVALQNGDVCVMFDRANTLAVSRQPMPNFSRKRNLTLRGSFAKFTHKELPALDLHHFVPYDQGDVLFSNWQLWHESYGEIMSIEEDMDEILFGRDEENENSISTRDLDDMNRDAYDGNSDAMWNTD